jgi:hypothetical protein
MKSIATALQLLVRLLFLVQLILGIAFWTDHAMNLLPVHMAAGVLLVICLWIMSVLGVAARVSVGQAIVAIIWGFIVIGLGFRQTELMTGSTHWIVQVLHLLVGMIAVGMNEGLARAIKGRP